MNEFISSQIISTIGWTIIYSLWQGLFISFFLATLLFFIDKKNSRTRSLISYFALVVLLAVSIRTYIDLDKNNSRQISTYSDSTNSSENLILKKDVSIFPDFSEKANSVIYSYSKYTNSFISSNINIIVLLWFAGIMILSIRLLGGIIYSQRLKHRDVTPVNQFWEGIITDLSTKFAITENVRLFQSKLVNFPVTIGYFKPVILLPIGFISGIPQNQLEIILAHELAHIKRADYILNIIQSIIEIFFFFNPAVWWISRTIRNEREYLCDDLAIEACGNSVTLAKALLFVKNSDYKNTKIAMAAIGNKHSLMGRIKRMTHSKNDKKIFSTVLAIIPLLLLLTSIACSSLDNEIIVKSNSTDQIIASTSVNSSSVGLTVAGFSSIESILAEPVEPVYIVSVSNSSKSTKLASAQSAFSVNSNFATNTLDDEKSVKISFREKGILWKAIFEEDKLIELYMDGKQVAESEFSKYEDLINEQYEVYTEGKIDFAIQMDQLKIDLEQLKVDLSELKNIEIDFNKEEFAREMKEMKRELKEGLLELKEMDLDFDIDLDFENLKENLESIKIDFSGLGENMSSLEIELSELKEELKILKYFINDLRVGLFEDGYIESNDEDFDLELTKTKMVVNNERLTDSIHEKYLELYKDHYGKDLDEDFNISN